QLIRREHPTGRLDVLDHCRYKARTFLTPLRGELGVGHAAIHGTDYALDPSLALEDIDELGHIRRRNRHLLRDLVLRQTHAGCEIQEPKKREARWRQIEAGRGDVLV